jgi:hypothetical protein
MVTWEIRGEKSNNTRSFSSLVLFLSLFSDAIVHAFCITKYAFFVYNGPIIYELSSKFQTTEGEGNSSF